MTYQEIHEKVTAYVGDRVDAGEYRKKIEQQIAYCPECRAAYEAEMKTRLVVRDRFARAQASDEVHTTIAGELVRGAVEEKEIAALQSQSRRNWLDRFVSPVGITIAIVLVLAGIGLLLYAPGDAKLPVVADNSSSTPSPASTVSNAPENFFNKTADNFDALLARKLPLQVETSDSKQLEGFFKDHGIDYPVLFMPVHLSLTGGIISERGKSKFAQMVYSGNDMFLYLFEVPYAALQRGDAVYVTSDVLQRLDQGESIWVEQTPGHPLVMFKHNDLVIAAVVNAPRATMEKLLSVR